VVVCNSLDGYFFPETLDELRLYVRQEERRGRSTFYTLGSARRLLQELEELTGNEELEDVAIGSGPLDASFKAINRMLQLSPVVIDRLGAASVMSGDKRYETADDMQVYLWSNGQYFATSLPKVNTEDYKLIGWYDNFGCAGGKKIRILVAVKTN